jgi:hypothetical protein
MLLKLAGELWTLTAYNDHPERLMNFDTDPNHEVAEDTSLASEKL